MLGKSILWVCASFCLLASSLSAQTLVNSFSFAKPPVDEGYYFPYEGHNGSKHILLYPGMFDFRVLYLDEQLNLIEDIDLGLEDGRYTYTILGFMDQAESLLIFAQIGGELRYTALEFDKKERSLKKTGLYIPLKINSLHSPLLYQDNALTSVQIHRKSSEVVVYRTRDGYELEADTFELDFENLYGELNGGDSNEMYVITAESGNSLFSNLIKNKIYLYGSQLHFSLEEHKEGIVTHIGIDLETKVPQITTYPLPRYDEEAILRANSIVYEDLILVSAYQEEGLKLEIHELGGTGLSQAYEFATDVEMDDYFLTNNAQRNDGTQLTDKKLLHPYLKRSLILSVEPTAEGDLWLIVGSVPQMSPAAQTALYFSVTVAAAFMGAAIDPNIGNFLVVDPAGAIETGGYFLLDLSERYGKFMYRVGAINASDLSLKPKTELGVSEAEASQEQSLPETAYDRMRSYLLESKHYRESAAAQIIFPYRNGLIKGYARKKEFFLYYFE